MSNYKYFINKKSEFESNFPFWMIYVVVIGIIITILVKIGNVTVAEASKIPKSLEDELILVSRFYNSGDCFAYVDDVSMVHAGIIDAAKFTQSNLNTCFPQSNIKYAFKLSLEAPLIGPGPVFTFGTVPVQTFNWEFTRFITTETIEKVGVLYDNKLNEGILRIKIKNVE